MPATSSTKQRIASVLTILQFVSITTVSTNKITCSDIGINVYNCSAEGLVVIPKFDTFAIEVDLSFNLLKAVSKTSFQGHRSLRALYLHNNNISEIEPYSFAELVHLQILDLSDNRLQNITQNMFTELTSLRTLNVSNNNISTIDHHSIFSLASLEKLILTGNELDCQCEEQLFKQLIQYRNARNSLQLDVQGALCLNNGQNDLFKMSIDACSHGEIFWAPSVNCYSCTDSPGLLTCGANRIENCGQNTDVCYSTITYASNRLSATAGCMNYIACLDLIAKNNVTCVQGNTTCFSCYTGSLSNTRNIAGYANEFVLEVSIELRAALSAGLINVHSQEYNEFTKNISANVKAFIQDERMGFWVEFDKLSGPQITVHLTIHCTSIWYITAQSVKITLFKTLPKLTLNGLEVSSVNIVPSNSEYCPPTVQPTADRGQINWPLTSVATNATIDCPFQFNNTRSVARRLCQSDKAWGSSSFFDCPLEDEQARALQEISRKEINNDNVADVSSELFTITNNWNTFTSTDIGLAVDTVDKILNVDRASTDDAAIDNTVAIINNLLNVEDDVLAESEETSDSSSKIIKAVDKLLSKIDKKFSTVKSNLAGFVSSPDSGAFNGFTLSFSDGVKDLTKSKISVSTAAEDLGADFSGIMLPKTLFKSSEKVTFTVYSDPKLFETISNRNDTAHNQSSDTNTNRFSGFKRKINSKVVAASVPNKTVTNLTAPVKIILKHEQTGKNVTCVYWSIESSEWLSGGCSVHATNEDFTECHCDHLTNFALLMDVYDVGGELDESNKEVLRIISIVGCAMSLAGALLTIIAYGIFRRLRKEIVSKILMQLCSAIAALNLVFLVGVQKYAANSIGGCKTVAVLLHYFLLAIMCWMLVEAFLLYKYVKVTVWKKNIPSFFQRKLALFAWGTPLIIVAVALAVNKTDNYGYQPGGICWLERIPFYVAFLAPVCTVFVLNVITYVLVLKKLFGKGSKELNKTGQNKNIGKRLRGAASVLVLLGLTWSFGILAIGDASKVFLYLFVICNAFQGLFIFVLQCLLNEEVRRAWTNVCPCLKSTSASTKGSLTYSTSTTVTTST
ncbi:adhesion G-protein coupled receptor G6-like isoform X2 [Dreissena polymorpha]|nr:adhesion G-protein coupled receptor G6-like isoform X2 [Dreissena polymorpha]